MRHHEKKMLIFGLDLFYSTGEKVKFWWSERLESFTAVRWTDEELVCR